MLNKGSLCPPSEAWSILMTLVMLVSLGTAALAYNNPQKDLL